MISYTITSVKLTPGLAQSGIIEVAFDFGDGSPVYNKRMMAPVAEGEKAVCAAVEGWIASYAPMRGPAPAIEDDLVMLVGKTMTSGYKESGKWRGQ